MKKIISLALVCIMMLGMLSMVSFADATAIEIYPYSNGWENWPSDNPQTQLLIMAPITPNDTTMGYTWKILSCRNLEFPMDSSFIPPLLCSGEIAPPPDSAVTEKFFLCHFPSQNWRNN